MGFQSGGIGAEVAVWTYWGKRMDVWMGMMPGAQSWV